MLLNLFSQPAIQDSLGALLSILFFAALVVFYEFTSPDIIVDAKKEEERG